MQFLKGLNFTLDFSKKMILLTVFRTLENKKELTLSKFLIPMAKRETGQRLGDHSRRVYRLEKANQIRPGISPLTFLKGKTTMRRMPESL